MPEPQPPSQNSSLINVLKLFGILIKLVVVACFIMLVGAVMFKDLVIKTAGAKAASVALGAPVHMAYFSWSFMRQRIEVRDLVVGHPPGFEEGAFVEIPKVIIEYDFGDFLKGNFRMPLVFIDLRQMTVIRSDAGPLNVDAVKAIQTDKKKTFEVPMFQIDVLKLSIGQVVYKDFFKKKRPQILVYNLNVKNKTFRNINNVPKLVTLVMIQALKPTAVNSAGVYAAGALMGIGFLPGAVLGIVVASDSAVAELAVGYAKAFETAERFMKEQGRVDKVDRDKGMMEGKIQGVDIKIRVEKISWLKSRMTVSGRKYMLAKKEFAAGILYQIGQLLKPSK